MPKRSSRMEKRDNYEKALREEEDALRSSIGQKPTAVKGAIAPRWARAERQKSKKNKRQ
jgi:hypothetical protein